MTPIGYNEVTKVQKNTVTFSDQHFSNSPAPCDMNSMINKALITPFRRLAWRLLGPAPERSQDHVGQHGCIRVQKGRPKDPFAAVQYRNQWFFIDATDHLSKRTFGTIQLLFELLAPDGSGTAPILSLPAG